MIKIKYDKIFVCQIKTTCDKEDESLGNKEIIEFGGCLLNVKTLQTSEAINLLIKSDKNISEFCTKKTGLTSEDVESGVDFSNLIEYVDEIYDTKNRPWASYGSFAKHVLKKQCQKSGIAFSFSDRFINIKSLLPIIFNLEHEISLREAMKRLDLGIPDGEDSMDDALNASITLKECIRGPILLNGNFSLAKNEKRIEKNYKRQSSSSKTFIKL